jgi:hypothetical protein
MDALYEASEWCCFLCFNGVHQRCRAACCVAVSTYYKDSDLVSFRDFRYDSEGLGFIDANRNHLSNGPNNVMDMWSTHLEGDNYDDVLYYYNLHLTMACSANR